MTRRRRRRLHRRRLFSFLRSSPPQASTFSDWHSAARAAAATARRCVGARWRRQAKPRCGRSHPRRRLWPSDAEPRRRSSFAGVVASPSSQVAASQRARGLSAFGETADCRISQKRRRNRAASRVFRSFALSRDARRRHLKTRSTQACVLGNRLPVSLSFLADSFRSHSLFRARARHARVRLVAMATTAVLPLRPVPPSPGGVLTATTVTTATTATTA